MNGAVKWLNAKKGFGFITTEEGTDMFAHFSQVQKEGFKTSKGGRSVHFDVVDSEGGLQVENIEIL